MPTHTCKHEEDWGTVKTQLDNVEKRTDKLESRNGRKWSWNWIGLLGVVLTIITLISVAYAARIDKLESRTSSIEEDMTTIREKLSGIAANVNYLAEAERSRRGR